MQPQGTRAPFFLVAGAHADEEQFLRYQEIGPDGSLPLRHCLHAGRLSFPHPQSGAEITITSPVPRDFRETLLNIA